MGNILPYSYSSLTSFENCPYQHYMVKIAKLVAPLPFKAAQDGIDVHKQAEDYIVKNEDFENPYAPRIKAVVAELREHNAPILAEVQLCVTATQTPCAWRADDGYSRGIIDVMQIAGPVAYLRDWKTGKPNAFSQQLKLNSLHIMMHYPEVEKVEYAYEWLKFGYATKGTVHREFLQDEWDKFERRVIKMKQAVVEDKWPKNKTGLCKAYCPVLECEHNGQANNKQ